MTAGMDKTPPSAPALKRADGAASVPCSKWFVAIVSNNTEKACAERLTRLGVENYVPVQTVVRVWKNGRKAKVDRVVIPAVVFIKCSEAKRREVVALPFINRFMTNKAASTPDGMAKPLATVNDREIKQLKFMLGQSDIPVTVMERSYSKGERVRIIRGSLTGLEGEVIDAGDGRSELTIALEYFGCAKLVIDTVNLAPVAET